MFMWVIAVCRKRCSPPPNSFFFFCVCKWLCSRSDSCVFIFQNICIFGWINACAIRDLLRVFLQLHFMYFKLHFVTLIDNDTFFVLLFSSFFIIIISCRFYFMLCHPSLNFNLSFSFSFSFAHCCSLMYIHISLYKLLCKQNKKKAFYIKERILLKVFRHFFWSALLNKKTF